VTVVAPAQPVAGRRLTLARVCFAASLPPAVVAGCAPFAALGWFADLCLHLSLLAALTLVPGVIILRRDPWRGGLLGVAVLAGCWPWLLAAYAPRAPLTKDGWSLVSANLYDFNPRRDDALAFVRDLDADLIAVQEVWPADEAVLSTRWPHAVWHRDRGLFASALLSRHPIRFAHIHPLEEYALVEALIDLPSGPLRVFVVHLASPKRPERAAMRARQLIRLAELVNTSREPVVVAGDFNLSVAAPAWREFCQRTGLLRPAGSTPSTWPDWLGPLGIDLDHIVGRGVTLAPLTSFSIPGSDHRAVRTWVAFP